MNKLYACIVRKDEERRKDKVPDPDLSVAERPLALIELAGQFAYRIEAIEDGVLFDVSGLENRIGSPMQIARSIEKELAARGIAGSLAVAANASTAELYARTRAGVTVIEPDEHRELPLSAIGLDADTLGVFHALGMETTADLRAIPEDELIARYGRDFRKTLDLINQNGAHILTPNLKEKNVAWDYNLDFPVEDFEQLIFILGHGLGKVLAESGAFGFSSEQIDITLGLDSKESAEYCIKLSFPTRDKSFWLKLMNLRIGNDPPEAAIVSLRLVCHFARPRAIERGLFAATRPEPESLLLTVDKIRKVVGNANVGVPALVDQRLPEAFELDGERLPVGKEVHEDNEKPPVLALTHFHPPLEANIRTSGDRLVYVSTHYFAGIVTEYGGAWLQSSQWWTRGFWQQMEWDVELDNRRIYRLARTPEGWFITGGYD
jgi:protein ImuB